MNKTDYREGEPQLVQFVREKGKRVPKMLKNGKLALDKKKKVIMVRQKGDPRGILVAGMIDGKVVIGWSYTNNKFDRFDKKRGMTIAVNRMRTVTDILDIPHQVNKELNRSFYDRVEKYFAIKD